MGVSQEDTKEAIERIDKYAKTATETATETPYANCVKMYSKDMLVLLQTNENCDNSQFEKAVKFYKANGYPVESAYYDLYGVRSMQLDNQEFSESIK